MHPVKFREFLTPGSGHLPISCIIAFKFGFRTSFFHPARLCIQVLPGVPKGPWESWMMLITISFILEHHVLRQTSCPWPCPSKYFQGFPRGLGLVLGCTMSCAHATRPLAPSHTPTLWLCHLSQSTT